MILNYLESIQQYLLNKRDEVSNQLDSLNNRAKEIDKFIDLLEEKNDPNYDVFSPRKKNSFDEKKISELSQEQKKIIEDISKVKDQLSEIDFHIDEVTNVIRVSRENYSLYDTVSDTYASRISILNSVEGERQRIARDLHDSTTQNLTALVHKTELCSKLLDSDPVRCRLELFSVSNSLREIIQDMRNLIYDLRPMSFDDIGFDTAINQVLDRFSQAHNIEISFRTVNQSYDMNRVIQITLLRVIQEACNNTVKYAGATHIDVTVSYLDQHVVLSVQDNGVGFDPEAVSEHDQADHSGFGLSMMKERVYLLSGKIMINSHPGDGCKIIVDVPINKEG